MAILGGGRRLVFWAPETLVKLAIPKEIALGAAMVRSLDQVIDAETGRVSGIGAAIVMRREGLDQELYVRLLAGTLDLDSRAPLTGRLRCEVANLKGEKLELDLADPIPNPRSPRIPDRGSRCGELSALRDPLNGRRLCASIHRRCHIDNTEVNTGHVLAPEFERKVDILAAQLVWRMR